MRIPLVSFAVVAAVAGCDLFTARVPCAVDDECDGGQVCVDGFCAVSSEGEGDEGEGDVVAEGEGEVVAESHPLRGTACDTFGAENVVDTALVCSIFAVFDEPCAVDADCGDPAARFCVDPGAGPAICLATDDATRTACPGNTDDTSGVFDFTDGPDFDCLDGTVVFNALTNCNATGTAFGIMHIVGGDLRVRTNHAVGDVAPPCTQLEALGFDVTERVGGDVFIGRDPGVTEQSDTQSLVDFVRMNELVVVYGGFTLTGTVANIGLSYDALLHIGGDVVVTDNDAATRLELRDLRDIGGDLIVENNPLMNRADLSSLQHVAGNVVIRGNPQLPRCALFRLETDGVVDGTVVIEDTNDMAVCP